MLHLPVEVVKYISLQLKPFELAVCKDYLFYDEDWYHTYLSNLYPDIKLNNSLPYKSLYKKSLWTRDISIVDNSWVYPLSIINKVENCVKTYLTSKKEIVKLTFNDDLYLDDELIGEKVVCCDSYTYATNTEWIGYHIGLIQEISGIFKVAHNMYGYVAYTRNCVYTVNLNNVVIKYEYKENIVDTRNTVNGTSLILTDTNDVYLYLSTRQISYLYGKKKGANKFSGYELNPEEYLLDNNNLNYFRYNLELIGKNVYHRSSIKFKNVDDMYTDRNYLYLVNSL
jgi:hypothetical protein